MIIPLDDAQVICRASTRRRLLEVLMAKKSTDVYYLAILTEYLWKNSGAVEADEEDEEAKYSTF